MNLISRFFDVGELVFSVECVFLSLCYLMVIIFTKSVFGCRTILSSLRDISASSRLVKFLDVFLRHIEVRGASGWIYFFRGSRMPIRDVG